jgi:hypothetical protein
MHRNLIYVPMFHLAHEQPDLVLKRSNRSRDAAFAYWSSVASVALELIQERELATFDVFCEDWSTQGQLKVAISNIANRVKYFHGAASFVGSMLALGGTPRITEDPMALKLADIAIKKQVRMINNPKLDKVPLMREEIVDRRDRAIAARMSSVVGDGGVAVLCMGGAHDVPAHLDNSWQTTIVTTPEFADEISAVKALEGLLVWPDMYRRQVAPLVS